MKTLSIIICAFGLTLMAEKEDESLTEGHSTWELNGSTLFTVDDTIPITSQGASIFTVSRSTINSDYRASFTGDEEWLSIYGNFLPQKTSTRFIEKWFPERVVIESDYKPIVRKHKNKWIIIFEGS